MDVCEYGVTGKPIKDCERYKALQAELELLQKKIKEIEEVGCYIADESGHTCGIATENKRLQAELGVEKVEREIEKTIDDEAILGYREENKQSKEVLKELELSIVQDEINIAPYAGNAFFADDEPEMKFWKGQYVALERVRKLIEGMRLGLLAEEEPPHNMLCVQHGGSAACEEVNKQFGFTCPKCAEESKVDE